MRHSECHITAEEIETLFTNTGPSQNLTDSCNREKREILTNIPWYFLFHVPTVQHLDNYQSFFTN
jgi:hypothetical protein